ncbi:MAG: hypothetical protein MJ245_01160 [Clostridia bacterium]|nr:hypothetical protein [Clostridia bacterium]
MTNVNQKNMELINDTEALLDEVNDDGLINLPLVKSQFLADCYLWNNVTIKLMAIYYDLYNSIEILDEDKRYALTKNIIDTLEYFIQTPEYKYFESSTITIFKDILEDIEIAKNFGIIQEDEYITLKQWANNEIKEISCVKNDVINNFRFVNIEFSFNNHYMRLDGIHYNGLTNDIFINKIIDKLYENDTSCAQVTKAQLENKGFYNRRVANILSDGSMIELYLEYDNPDGCGLIRFVRSGAITEEVSCYTKQEGFDASPDAEEKDSVINRCMNELFNIMQIVEAL